MEVADTAQIVEVSVTTVLTKTEVVVVVVVAASPEATGVDVEDDASTTEEFDSTAVDGACVEEALETSSTRVVVGSEDSTEVVDEAGTTVEVEEVEVEVEELEAAAAVAEVPESTAVVSPTGVSSVSVSP